MSTILVQQADAYSKPDGVSRLVSHAMKYQSSIYLRFEEMDINAKSIMGVAYFFSRANEKDIKITATGDDESEALADLRKFLS